MTVRSHRRSLILTLLAIVLAAPLAFAQEEEPPQADLLVEKSGPAVADAGSNVTYTVTINNLGPEASSSITLTDPVPAGMTFVSAVTDPAFSCLLPTPGLGGTITCTTATLAASASATFTFVFNIPGGTAPGTTFVNIATATSLIDPNVENDSGIATTSTPPPPSADMGVSKTGPGAAGPNTDVVYTIVVTNGGPDAASNVTVSDTLPGTMTFVSITQTGTPMDCSSTPAVGSGGTVSCTAATYPVGGTTTLTLTGHIPTGTSSGTLFANTATVSATTTDPNPVNNSSPTLLTVSTVDISVTKQGPPPPATAGDPLSYAILIANGGPDTAVNVQLNDPLPSNTTFMSLTQNNGPVAFCSTPSPGETGTVTCTFPTLASGASAEFTLVIQAGDTTSITNTATGTTDSFDTDHDNDSFSTTTTVAPRANVGVTKNGPGMATAGANITYTVTVTNGGPSTAATVSLTDTLPANTTFVSLTQTLGPTFTCNTPGVGSPGTITCTIATLAPNASATFSIVVRLAPSVPAGGSVANTANVSTTTTDPDPDNNMATTTATTVVSADVGVVKSGPDSVTAGSTVTYTVVVTNGGPSDASTVSLTDTLPPNTTFVSANQTIGPAFTCMTPSVGGTGTITCTIATLASGASATLSIVLSVSPSATGSLSNTANVSTTTSDPSSANNMSTKVTTVAVGADVSVSKSGPSSVPAGSSVTYTLTVANAGPSAATTVSLTDTLPSNTTFVSLNQTVGPSFTCLTPSAGGTGTITCTIATFASGASATFSLVLNVSPTAAGPLTNTANVSATSADPNTGNNTSSTTANVVNADVSVAKSGPASVPAGTNVTYTVTVTNAGPSDATNVSLTDTLPPSTTFVSENQTNGPEFTCATPSPGGTGTITCTIATFASGASATFTIVLNVSPTATGPLTNTANVGATSPDPNSGNNTSSTTATVISPDVSVTKNGPASVPAGTNVTYTVTVTNAGPPDATNVSLTDTLPPNTTFVSESQTSGPAFTCATPSAGGTGTITCTIATFASGASATFSIVLKVSPTATGQISNTANVTATGPDPNPANNSATASTTVTPGSADAGIVKSAAIDSETPVKSVTYTIVVTNHGAAAASNVVVTDVLPADATLTSATTTQGSCAGTSAVTCTIGTLAPGGSATIRLAVTFPPTTRTISNTATVTSDNDTDPANNSSTAGLPPAAAIPTLAPLAFALLGLTLLLAGFFVLRVRRSSPTP